MFGNLFSKKSSRAVSLEAMQVNADAIVAAARVVDESRAKACAAAESAQFLRAVRYAEQLPDLEGLFAAEVSSVFGGLDVSVTLDGSTLELVESSHTRERVSIAGWATIAGAVLDLVVVTRLGFPRLSHEVELSLAGKRIGDARDLADALELELV